MSPNCICTVAAAVIAAVLEALGKHRWLRPAEPGEFTRRAFENGKLDLTQAEGLADLVEAETEAQRRAGPRQLGRGGRAEAGGARLIEALAQIEAASISPTRPMCRPMSSSGAVAAPAAEIEAALAEAGAASACATACRRHRRAAQCRQVEPAERLAARRGHISALAGTTRDVIEAHLDLGGFPVVLLDTAGLREPMGQWSRRACAGRRAGGSCRSGACGSLTDRPVAEAAK